VSKALFESINEQNYFFCLEQLGFFIKIFIILYADDTVIMSETEEGIQQALLNFEQYCDLWKNGKYSGIDGIIFWHNPILHTVSKALFESINEQNYFFPKEK
jgi:hypothetical protein